MIAMAEAATAILPKGMRAERLLSVFIAGSLAVADSMESVIDCHAPAGGIISSSYNCWETFVSAVWYPVSSHASIACQADGGGVASRFKRVCCKSAAILPGKGF